MNDGNKPPEKDRRSSPRQSPSYTPEQISNLRITRVHFREEYLFCLLSDGNMVCVPLDIAPRVAPNDVRYNWQITNDGRSVSWVLGATGVATEHLSLIRILAHPNVQIMDLPGD